jgi:cytochrome P450
MPRKIDLLDVLIREIEDDEVLKDNVFSMLIVGTDTTSSSESWLVYLLAANPKAQEEARREVDAVLGTTWTAPVTGEQVAQLKFVNACIMEALRTKPPFRSVFLTALKDVKIRDQEIPNGTHIGVMFKPDMLAPGEDYDNPPYNPLQWMDEEKRPGLEERLLSFGGGARICPGKAFAIQELTVVTAALLSYFDDWKVVDKNGNPASLPIDEFYVITSFPKDLYISKTDRRGKPGAPLSM